MLLLDQLWAGDVAPGEHPYRKPDEYRKLRQQAEQHKAAVEAELSEKGQEAFEQFVDAYLAMGSLSDRDSFVSGFRAGVLTMIDVFCPDAERRTNSL